MKSDSTILDDVDIPGVKTQYYRDKLADAFQVIHQLASAAFMNGDHRIYELANQAELKIHVLDMAVDQLDKKEES
ncbi:hypothetical protein [Bifidobacterium miconisargentati]|uniref:hypothetical protein n=1 Tax=Bifidobacterium miconisargentati TaxID=2834437 RepID=UPI001BDD9B9C|nr:hypothetical protein [Bifidobacterium miconisargentati]MBW3090403.1 hypothetical protein [Bifidobacterium miconisargentati]